MSDTFVDFKEIKQRVAIEAVLAHYNIQLRRANRHSLRGACPLPTHTSETSKDSFSVHTSKNMWACQSTSCAAARQGRKGGNILDFVSIMANCSIRDAALMLRDWFLLSSVSSSSTTGKGSEVKEKLVSENAIETGDEENNKPLTFALKEINHAHPYVLQRGITAETATTFGVGFFPGRGSMSGRVVIPIHNNNGELVAYAGRSIDGTEPKYRLPTGFKKSAELFNLHRVRALSDCDRVIVCEGFFDCMKVHQAGFSAVVGLMGSSLSDAHEKSLKKYARVILFLDGDDAGREAAHTISQRLAHHTFVRIIDLPDGKQPDELSSDEIKIVLGSF